MTPPIMILLLKIFVPIGLAGAAAWIIDYSRAKWWRNVAGRNLTIKTLIIAGLLIISGVELYGPPSYLLQLVLGWCDIGLVALIGPILFWRLTIFRRLAATARHCPNGHPVLPTARYCPQCAYPMSEVPMPHKPTFRAGGQGHRLRRLLLPDHTKRVMARAEAAGPVTYVVDLSEFQPDLVDATYLAWSHGIIIRAAYGDAHDDKAWYNGDRRAQLHAGGVKFLGIYIYLVKSQDGAAQADALHRLVGGLQKGEVLIADYEEGAKSVLTAFYNRILTLGYPAQYLWTYTGLSFGQANGVLPVEWLADYTATEPASPHILWQFTSTYTVPGIAGKVDCSLYHGTIDQLAGLAFGQQPAPPPAPQPVPVPGPISQDEDMTPSVALWKDASGDVLAYHAARGVNDDGIYYMGKDTGYKLTRIPGSHASSGVDMKIDESGRVWITYVNEQGHLCQYYRPAGKGGISGFMWQDLGPLALAAARGR